MHFISAAWLVCIGLNAIPRAFPQDASSYRSSKVASIKLSTLNDGVSRNDFSGAAEWIGVR
jgi:hypothetical protein